MIIFAKCWNLNKLKTITQPQSHNNSLSRELWVAKYFCRVSTCFKQKTENWKLPHGANLNNKCTTSANIVATEKEKERVSELCRWEGHQFYCFGCQATNHKVTDKNNNKNRNTNVYNDEIYEISHFHQRHFGRSGSVGEWQWIGKEEREWARAREQYMLNSETSFLTSSVLVSQVESSQLASSIRAISSLGLFCALACLKLTSSITFTADAISKFRVNYKYQYLQRITGWDGEAADTLTLRPGDGCVSVSEDIDCSKRVWLMTAGITVISSFNNGLIVKRQLQWQLQVQILMGSA